MFPVSSSVSIVRCNIHVKFSQPYPQAAVPATCRASPSANQTYAGHLALQFMSVDLPLLDEWTQQVHQLLRRSVLIEVRRVEQEMEPQESEHNLDDCLRVGIRPN